MKIGLYISDILLRAGGTEANCAYIVYALQKKFDYPEITVLSEKYKNIDIKDNNLVPRLNSLFGLSIENINVNLELIPTNKTNFIQRAFFGHRIKNASRKYDVFFNCSMNSYTFEAKYNIIIIHFPPYSKTKSDIVKKYPFLYFYALLNNLLFSRGYDLYITYSLFTTEWLEKIWHIGLEKAVMIDPAVGLVLPSKNEKTNSIFVCSRIEQSKNIEALISAYLSCEILKKTYKLIIAGAVVEETISYFEKLRKISSDYIDFISFHENPSRSDIENYYSLSKIFWHAKGYGVDEKTNPYDLEHFGLTTVEAMSAGCVPVVINKGGQKEIVENGVNGFRWDTPEELVEKTVYLIQHEDEREKMAENAIEKAKHYSLDNFTENLGKVLKSKLV